MGPPAENDRLRVSRPRSEDAAGAGTTITGAAAAAAAAAAEEEVGGFGGACEGAGGEVEDEDEATVDTAAEGAEGATGEEGEAAVAAAAAAGAAGGARAGIDLADEDDDDDAGDVTPLAPATGDPAAMGMGDSCCVVELALEGLEGSGDEVTAGATAGPAATSIWLAGGVTGAGAAV